MPPTANRADLLPAGWAALAIAALFLGLATLWFLTHLGRSFIPRKWLPQLTAFLARAALGCATLWAFFQLLARAFYLATPWPLILAAAMASIAIELVVLLYERERRIIPKKTARMLIALRISALLTLAIILLQPVLAIDSERRLRREIVLLLDDSESMQLAAQQLTPSEKLKIATLFGIDGARRKSTLTDVQRGLQLLDSQLIAESRNLDPPSGASAAAANSLISQRTGPLAVLLENAQERITELARITRRVSNTLTGENAASVENFEDRLTQNVRRNLNQAQQNLSTANYPATAAEIQNASRQISYLLEQLPPIIETHDLRDYQALPANVREKIDATATATRSAIARRSLVRNQFVEKLGKDYQLRFIRFARGVENFAESEWFESGLTTPADETPSNFRSLSDFTTALESALETVPAGSLAGILLLSDGRHNAERSIEDAARRLGLQQAPICSVVIGSSIGPKDACILDVRVPEVIYLDDQAVIYADLKLDGLSGETVTISLLKDNQLLESQDIEIADNAMRTTARFAHTPDQLGISEYTVHASLSPGETFTDNNRWKFEVAITDDRTNVIIIEGHPRWEFRYLRNLFHARDKSVHLQYVLLNPDEISDTPPGPDITASADRTFGNSEATTLPISLEEWMKFDAIIIGDVVPASITDEAWKNIRHCVSERGALLVTIAGQRHMPHSHASPILDELLPVEIDSQALETEPAYRLRLTPAGQTSLIMQQSPDPNLNEMVWGSLPPLHWRSPIASLKPGTEVLAYAHPLASSDSRTPTSELQNERALIVTQRFAAGKVVALMFDRTWRLRYGVGDVHHHKFWGQLLRWGTGENLRSGNDSYRLGTDKLSYEPGERIQITAKVIASDVSPQLSAVVYQNENPVVRKQLTFRQESNGIFETTIPSIPGEGRFKIVIENAATDELAAVETEFLIAPSRNAVELSELTADAKFLGRLAALSGGSVAAPDNAPDLRKFFAPPGQIIRERKETSLWDNFPLLIVFLALLSTEWIARRTAGLA